MAVSLLSQVSTKQMQSNLFSVIRSLTKKLLLFNDLTLRRPNCICRRQVRRFSWLNIYNLEIVYVHAPVFGHIVIISIISADQCWWTLVDCILVAPADYNRNGESQWGTKS